MRRLLGYGGRRHSEHTTRLTRGAGLEQHSTARHVHHNTARWLGREGGRCHHRHTTDTTVEPLLHSVSHTTPKGHHRVSPTPQRSITLFMMPPSLFDTTTPQPQKAIIVLITLFVIPPHLIPPIPKRKEKETPPSSYFTTPQNHHHRSIPPSDHPHCSLC